MCPRHPRSWVEKKVFFVTKTRICPYCELERWVSRAAGVRLAAEGEREGGVPSYLFAPYQRAQAVVGGVPPVDMKRCVPCTAVVACAGALILVGNCYA